MFNRRYETEKTEMTKTKLYRVHTAQGVSIGSWFATTPSIAIARAITGGRRTTIRNRAMLSEFTAHPVPYTERC